jgi:hypothetical protein
MTGANSGELTVWDGRNFAWESVLQVRLSGAVESAFLGVDLLGGLVL